MDLDINKTRVPNSVQLRKRILVQCKYFSDKKSSVYV